MNICRKASIMKNIKLGLLLLTMAVLLSGCEKTTEEVTTEEETTEEAVVEETEISKVSFGTFTATTIEGEEVTESIFADYDLTMVNIWATWCSPCVNEMEELQEVYAGLAENVNMISICYDGESSTETAQEIFDGNGVEFIAIIPNDEIMTNVFSTIRCFPTTMFVDSEGNIIGDYLEGAPSSDVVAVYEAYIEMYLELAGVE